MLHDIELLLLDTAMIKRSSSKFLWPSVAGLIFVSLALFVVLRVYASREFKHGRAGWSGINAPYIQTNPLSVQKMVELAQVTRDDLVYDLGCGDGRLVIGAVAQSDCRGIGIDIEAARIEESTENAKQRGLADRIEFRQQDIFEVDLSDGSVALIYLTKWMLEKLKPQLDNMKPGSRIVSQDYWIEQVRPQQIESVDVEQPDGRVRNYILYLYRTPLHHDLTMEYGTPPKQADIR